MEHWKIWLGRVGAIAAVACGIVGLIVGFSDAATWKLGVDGWLTGGVLAALLAIGMYLEDAADSRRS